MDDQQNKEIQKDSSNQTLLSEGTDLIEAKTVENDDKVNIQTGSNIMNSDNVPCFPVKDIAVESECHKTPECDDQQMTEKIEKECDTTSNTAKDTILITESNPQSEKLNDEDLLDNDTSTKDIDKNCNDPTATSIQEKEKLQQKNDESKEYTVDSDVKMVCDNVESFELKIEPAAQQNTSAMGTKEYRGDDKFASDGDDEDSSSSDSDSSDADLKTAREAISDHDDDDDDIGAKHRQRKHIIKTYGEMGVEDLPPLEELKITVDDSVSMIDIGCVSSIVGVLVVIQGKLEQSPLDIDSVLFLEDRKPFGRVFETLGPVKMPFYSVRFNCPDDITETGVELGQKIYYAPEEEKFTSFVFVRNLIHQKGSDASWEHNNEPPQKYIEYSDDDQERKAKAKNRKKPDAEQQGEGSTAKKRFEHDANAPKGNQPGGRGKPGQNREQFSKHKNHRNMRDEQRAHDAGERFEKYDADRNKQNAFQSNSIQSWPPKQNTENSNRGTQQFCPPPRPKMIPDDYSLSYNNFRPRPPRFAGHAPPRFTGQRAPPSRGQFQHQQQQQRHQQQRQQNASRPSFINGGPFSGDGGGALAPQRQQGGGFDSRGGQGPGNFNYPPPSQSPSQIQQQQPQMVLGQNAMGSNLNHPAGTQFVAANTGQGQGQMAGSGMPFMQQGPPVNANMPPAQNMQFQQGPGNAMMPAQGMNNIMVQQGNNTIPVQNMGQNPMNPTSPQQTFVPQNRAFPPNAVPGQFSNVQNIPVNSSAPSTQQYNQRPPVFMQANQQANQFGMPPNFQNGPPQNQSYPQQFPPQQPIGQLPPGGPQHSAYQVPSASVNAPPPPFGGPPIFGGASYAPATMVDRRYMNNPGNG